MALPDGEPVLMLGVLAQIDGYDPVAAATVTLRGASVDDTAVCHLDNQVWWPGLIQLPTLAYDLFDGGFGGAIGTPASSMALAVEPWPNLPRYNLADARIRLWTGEVGAPWANWTQRFDGRVSNQPVVDQGVATLGFAVDDRWLDKPLLATYAGTTGAEGPAALKGTVKPLALGAPRYATGVLIDPVNSVFQVSGYGAIEGVEAALDRLVRFTASAGDYATYAALVAATIAPGQWATCKAAGLVRFGAPPVGPVSFLLRGDKAGADGWARKPGQLIRRIALLAGGAGKIDDASLNALDAARPYNLSVYVGEQTTARELIQSIAASVNHVAGVSWLGKLFVAPVGIATASLTLQADGSALPPVAAVQQMEMGTPWTKLAIEAEKTVTVHAYSDVAFTAELVDMGDYSDQPAGTVFREGNIVQDQGSSWLYINPTPTSGNAPPTLPTTSNSYWKALAKAGDKGDKGDPGDDGAPGAPGADGQTLYEWVAYADSPDGTVNFTTGAPGDRVYQGRAINKTTATESTNPADYQWQTYVGPIGFGLVNFANMNIAGNKITKIGGASWAASVYSSEAWIGGAFISWRAGQADKGLMIGLGADPTTDANYTSIDYAFYAVDSGVATIYEDGVNRYPGGLGSYTADTIFSIHYDGANVRYYMDGVLKRTVAAPAGLKLYLDSSFAQTGGSATILGFGPAGAVGADGLSIAELNVYRRATSAPATPSGGSYNFATKALTAPSGWSATIPAGNDPLYEATGTASVQGTAGTATPAWAGVGLRSQDGTGANMIFRRSAAQPATPAASAGVPTGWYDSTGSVPAGADPIWTSFGTRPNAGANWTWQTAKRVEGEDGISPVSIAISPNTATVQLNKDGTVKSGQLPLNFVVTAMQGGSVIPLTSLTINASSGGTWSEDDAKITLSALTDENAEVKFTAVAGGQSVVGVIAVSTAQDGAGGASTSLDTASTLTIAGYSSYTQVGGDLAINVSSAGKLKVNFYGMIRPDGGPGYQWQSKIQYSLNGGSSWVDVSGSARDSSATFELDVPPFGMRGGTLSSASPLTITGLTADAPALVRALVQRKSGSTAPTGTVVGTLTLYAEQAL